MTTSKIKVLLRALTKCLKKNPDRYLRNVSGVVHIGANTGQERDTYNSYGLRVVWIEPNPEVFSVLIHNLQGYEKQLAYQALVTDVDEREYEFNISNNNGLSSSILDFKHHKDIWPNVDYTKTIKLKSITLDTLFKRENLDPTQYQALILDTQGTELLVLQGSLIVLNNFEFIKTEVPDFEAYGGCCTLLDISDFMIEHGYKELHRTKFAGRSEGGSYFDVVYTKI